MDFLSDINDYFVLVDKDLWDKTRAGDKAAWEKIKNHVNGLVVYFHVIHPANNEVPVSIDDLIKYNVIRALTIHTKL